MNSPVIVILDPIVEDGLESLGGEWPIWIVNSPHNDLLVQQARERDPSRQLTTFRQRVGEQRHHLLERIVPTIDQHHNEQATAPPYDELAVFGVRLPDVRREAFSELGFAAFSETAGGFIASKGSRKLGAS